MRSLEELGVKYGTGKSSLTCDYLRFYDLLFGQLKYKHIKILEAGVQFGNSLRMWREYFVYAHIIGIDSIDNGLDFKLEDGILVEIGDAYSDNMLARIGELKFDIIIDDGSHLVPDQQWFVRNYSRRLTDDGILIVEDVLTRKAIPMLIEALPFEYNYSVVEMPGKELCRLFLVWPKAISKPQQSEPDSAAVNQKSASQPSPQPGSCQQPSSDASCSDQSSNPQSVHSISYTS